MRAFTRRQVEAAQRALDFTRAHPSDDPGFVALAQQLDDALTRATALAAEQHDADLEERAATERRQELRRLIVGDLLRPLARAGTVAAKATPALLVRFESVPVSAPTKDFLTVATRALEDARAHAETLRTHGVAAELIDELAAYLAEFNATLDRSAVAERRRVTAVADLVRLTTELVRILRLLDAHYRFALRRDPAKLHAWSVVRAPIAAPRPSAAPAESDAADTAAEPPAATDRPAA